MMKIRSGLLIGFLFLIGCSTNDDQPATTNNENPSNNEEDSQEELVLPIEGLEVIAEDLDVPWSIEKSEDTFYLTERTGSIVQVEDGEAEWQDVELEHEVSTASEAGLLGFVLAPDFSESNQAYAYYTYESNEGQFNRVVTLQLEDNIWSEESVLLDDIPSGTYHHGGRLKIGPDGLLYATAGDASEREIAQDLDSLGGKILRMNLDGSIPEDNPFPDSYVYSYGHRNAQGITWSPDDTMYASEHGDNANDEVNVIEAGENYGWPIIEGEEEQEGMVVPLFTSGNEETWAPSGMAYDDDKLYVAALRGSAVLEFDLETGDYREVIRDLGRIRDVRVEDNYLYFVSNNGDGRGTPENSDDRLYRIALSDLE
ncbi:sorbosone dehydrogenase family protein [Virgibacillus sp. NKC19-3]|uniref:PQQ-dependent sugar dehydrogenase n=1 Tax=Virgibacillus saliphilus TaxID=2831674 RepID=UPI001C9B973F|nr:sorbosone dehydrogenase family protein [Virgibacillus sp. NKC19-3]MBY7142596.1 sorbosone dehydrogenase family protein [Virgibacillus sp. NKC19-3]